MISNTKARVSFGSNSGVDLGRCETFRRYGPVFGRQAYRAHQLAFQLAFRQTTFRYDDDDRRVNLTQSNNSTNNFGSTISTLASKEAGRPKRSL